MASAFQSGTNTFVPTFDASGQLVVNYSRNIKDFRLNKYVTLVPVKKSTGYFLRITPDNAARVLNTDGAEFIWHDNNEAPRGYDNKSEHEFFPFNTTRYNFPFALGYKAVEQADWKIMAQYAAMVAQQAMTLRTLRVVTAITTSANYASGHDQSATTWGGAKFDTGTATSPVLKRGLNAMAQQILKATVGAVKPDDLILVMGPAVADALARTQEIHSYLKEQVGSLSIIENQLDNPNTAWGLPKTLYGYRLVVEDAVRVTSKKGATLASSFAYPTDELSLIARPGGLTGIEGGPSWSFCHIFSYEEMTVESKDDPDNRRHNGRVVEDYDVQIVSPVAGARASDVLT